MYVTRPWVHADEREAFQLPHALSGCPLHSWRAGQSRYSAIKLLFAGVTHSGGCVDGVGTALEVCSHMHAHTHIIQAGEVQATGCASPT